eukprot:3169575-Pleurochrysis_carterae.AAC.2
MLMKAVFVSTLAGRAAHRRHHLGGGRHDGGGHGRDPRPALQRRRGARWRRSHARLHESAVRLRLNTAVPLLWGVGKGGVRVSGEGRGRASRCSISEVVHARRWRRVLKRRRDVLRVLVRI